MVSFKEINNMSYKKGEEAAENEIKQNGFDIDLWNEFLENPNDFNKLFSKLLHDQTDEFIRGYKSYYSSYSLWAETKAYRNDLPDWRTPWKKKKKDR